ncbi:hypothetical protein FRC07_013723 [Ceratobasidium sp. 392]|nr:hypothetical protein FRC07_013723 [Ceratobasidium sp. 392]
MQEAIQALRKPLPEIEESIATQFTSVVNESLGENKSSQPDIHTCKLLFEILGYASLQSDSLVTALLYGISTVTYLSDPRLLDDDNVPKHIERWISHPLVARYLNEPDMRDYMLGGRDQETAPENLARWDQLQASISQWGDFHSVFDHSDEDVVLERLPQVSRWLRTSLSTAHFGPIMIWRLWNQSNIVDFSSSDSVLSNYDNLILGTRHFLPDSVSLLDLFRATLKAHMGVATVLSVVWWSRFPPDAVACRALSVLKLWAESNGIREIVRMLALVPVFYEALSELTLDVPLHKSGLYAQQLLEALNVSVDETEELAPEVVTTAPEPPQISGHLDVMVDLLKLSKLDDITVKRVNLVSQRILRQAKEAPEDEPWAIFSDAHQSTSETFMLTQVEVFGKLSEFMNTLTETPLDTTTSPVMASLLTALVNVVETISLLLPYANIPACTARSLSRLAATVFISSDLVLSRNRRQAQIVEQCHVVRETCIQLLRTFVALNDSHSAFDYPGAEHVLSQVLSVWVGSDAKDSLHICVSQTAVLLGLVLPLPAADGDLHTAQDFWVREIVRVMPQLEQLLAVLPPRHWVPLALRLVELDRGSNSVGLGSWLAFNELHTLGALIGRVALDADTGKLAVMLRVADRSISLLGALLQDVLQDNTIELITRDSQALSTLVQCFEILVDHHATTSATATLAAALAPHATDEPRALRRLLTTALLRGCRLASPFSSLLAIPTLLVPHRTFATRDMDLDLFGTDIGLALVAICVSWDEDVESPAEVWEAVVHILEWVTEYEDPSSIYLHGLSQTTLDQIRTLTLKHAPERISALDVSRAIIAFSEEVPDDLKQATAVVPDTAPFTSTSADLRAAASRKQTYGSRESTPPPSRGPFDILALASLSPRAPTSPITPTAPLSLTKMYSQNEFRSV